MAAFTGNIEASMPELFAIVGPKSDVDSAKEALDQAAHIIETVSGISFDGEYRDTGLLKSDALWLRKATVFQAAWLMEQPDALSRVGASSMSQDGLSISTSHGLSFVLAPMAERALGNCSWNRTSTTRISTRRERTAVDYAVSDDHAWQPLAGA